MMLIVFGSFQILQEIKLYIYVVKKLWTFSSLDNTYPLPRHQRMNDKENLHIKEDIEIRNLLIKESIIQVQEWLDVVNGVIKKDSLDRINTTNHIKPSVTDMNVDFVGES